MTDDTKARSRLLDRRRALELAVSSLLHLAATSVIFVVFCATSVNQQARGLLWVVLGEKQLQQDAITPLLIIFGLCACGWAAIVLAWTFARQRVKTHRVTALRTARGTVMTETLIVLPVFLLLTFGLGQMAVNSVAGLLTTLGTYEAARTVAVWGPEVGNQRGDEMPNVSASDANEKARVAAAAVIAPGVPFARFRPCSPPKTIKEMTAGLAPYLAISGGSTRVQTTVNSLSEAFGRDGFIARSNTRLLMAYCATKVSYTAVETDPGTRDRKEFTTTVQYAHPSVFPIVGRIFRKNPGAGPWVTRNVSVISRKYTMTQQMTPNTNVPKKSFIQSLLNPNRGDAKGLDKIKGK